MKKLKMIVLALMVFTLHVNAKQQSATDPKPVIVLVHGAWSDASSWSMVTPYLKAAGYKVIAMDLPAHGKDKTPYSDVDLNSYVNTVIKAIGDKKVVLVGHSFAGLVIGEVAERIPNQIQKLVYLSAYIPENGQNVLQLSGTDKQTLLPTYLVVNKENGTGSIKAEGIPLVFADDASEMIKKNLVAHIKPEPLKPFNEPATITPGNYGQVKKAYIYTLNDKAIGIDLQQSMAGKANITVIHTIKSSHLSLVVKPKEVAKFIIEEAK